MKRVEVIDALLVVEVEDGEEADDDAGERKGVKNGVQQFDVDAPEASTDAVKQDRCECQIHNTLTLNSVSTVR